MLSIDAEFQQYAYERLNDVVVRTRAEAGAIVAMDPSTGRIIALVSHPSYDPNLFARGISQAAYTELANDTARPLFHRAVMGQYPPGSTVKPMLAAIGLEEGLITDSTIIVDRGEIVVPNVYDPSIIYRYVGWDRSGLGAMNVYSAIARSSDIYFYYLAGGFEDFVGFGADRLAAAYRQFHTGEPLGIDLPSEASGLIPTPSWKEETVGDPWVLGDSYNMGIGQGNVLVTPLHVTSWTATIANGGTIYQPRLVYKTINPQSGVTTEKPPIVLEQNVVSQEHIAVIQRAMRQTVTQGSGRSLQSKSYTSAGKTGTAQYANNTKLHAWYTSYAPYERPEIALTVLLENGGEGNEAAVPLTADLYDWWFTNR